KGQPIATVECSERRAQQLAAAARVKAAAAELDKLKAGSRIEDIAMAEADAKRAEARLFEAKAAFTKEEELHQAGSTSVLTLERALATAQAAEAEKQHAEAALAAHRQGFRSEDIAKANAEHEAAIANQAHAAAAV